MIKCKYRFIKTTRVPEALAHNRIRQIQLKWNMIRGLRESGRLNGELRLFVRVNSHDSRAR
jgi:hypothetical protein